jgi:D-3-phosphoglycerate dehydrogenase
MIDSARGFSRSVQAYRSGRAPDITMGRELRGSRAGIVGYGHIGRRLADLLLALGMHVAVSDPQARPDDARIDALPLDALLAQSDFVICLAPALPETENLMNAAAFAQMKPGAFFVNASRGNLVDEAALRAALDGGRLAGAALDVGRAPDQMPSPELAAHPRVIATPHIGGLTPPAIEHQALQTVAQLAALLRGEWPEGAVNASQAARLAAWRQPKGEP